MRRSRGFERDTRAEVVRKLLARDGSDCGICGQALDSDAPIGHPASTTVDHIVPLGNGGEYGSENRIDNLRLAHELCNGMLAKFPSFKPSWYARELRRTVASKGAA